MAASPNRLLDFLAPRDFEWLSPQLEYVELTRGTVLADEGETLKHTYFPHTAVVSLVSRMEDGRIAEMASFGREALIGGSLYNIPLPTIGRYIVQIAGGASRIESHRLEQAAAARPGIQRMIGRHTELLMTQTLRHVACNAAHSVEARCSRWIVATHDRLKRDDLPLTHELLAEILGVQRSTVSAVIGALQSRSLIRQGRGSIVVVDRPGLQEAACECYGVLREKHLHMLPSVPR
jgi:CRP-like cAMP-binding protein